MAHANLEVVLTSGRLTDQDELHQGHAYLEVMLTSGLIKMSSIKVAHANLEVANFWTSD